MSPRSPSIPTAVCWPRAITTGSSGSGIRRPAGRSVDRSLKGRSCGAWRSAPTASGSRWGSPTTSAARPARGLGSRRRAPIGPVLPCPHYVSRLEFRPDGRVLLAGSVEGFCAGLLGRDHGSPEAIGEPIVQEAPGGVPSRRSDLRHPREGRHGQAPRWRPRGGRQGAALRRVAGNLRDVPRRRGPGRRGFRGRHGPALRPGHVAAGRAAPFHEAHRPSGGVRGRWPVGRRHRPVRRAADLAPSPCRSRMRASTI